MCSHPVRSNLLITSGSEWYQFPRWQLWHVSWDSEPQQSILGLTGVKMSIMHPFLVISPFIASLNIICALPQCRYFNVLCRFYCVVVKRQHLSPLTHSPHCNVSVHHLFLCFYDTNFSFYFEFEHDSPGLIVWFVQSFFGIIFIW